MPKDPIGRSPFIPHAQDNPALGKKPGGPRMDRLNALFGGPGAPAPGPRVSAVSSGAMESRMRMERLKGARSQQEITDSVNALLAHHHLPDDPEMLCKMLIHPDAGVGEKVLSELGALQGRGRLQVTSTMKDQLQAFAPRCREPLAKSLLEKLLGHSP